ncbi:MAG TPA: phosphoadenosine phosphosulfate reductase family protein [Negativicutes bacterium]|nr:phosphoadenosine phosphosulfate reductase family protein [Negativicutes bacterium]
MFISYQDLELEQNKGLDYKIESAVKAIASALKVCNHRPALAFSAGKDSTVLWHLFRTHFPDWLDRLIIIYGNTGVEYPECLTFAKQLAQEWGHGNFYEATPGRTEDDGLKYAAQQEILQYLIDTNQIRTVLKDDGKLKSGDALERACPDYLREKFVKERITWPAGTRKNFWWCVDQYGWPLLGKARSKLKARRINIDCFLRFSQSVSQDEKLLAYYKLLKQVKFSQACCDILKKEPSERLQAEMDVDVIFKGLMAAESRTRQTNFVTRGYLLQSHRDHLGSDPFWHCNPLSIWTDDDIWAYIHRFSVPYSSLYDMGWTDNKGVCHKIKRNGCMGCGTDLLYPNNHMAMLRRTHPKFWHLYMSMGMAQEIQNIQIARRNGQVSLFDYFGVEALIEERPCIFDRIDHLIYEDDTIEEYDPDMDDEAS